MTPPKLLLTREGCFVFLEEWTFVGITIPSGFESDGTSSPWWARAIIPRVGPYVYASFVHDYCLTIMSREDALELFREALRELGSRHFHIHFRYWGIKLYDKFIHPLKTFQKKK